MKAAHIEQKTQSTH